jgi:3-oxoacyl-[acyl-carrier-protein] synthase-1
MNASAVPIAVINTGLVTSVGLSAPATCAAIRAKLTNPSPTGFVDAGGEFVMAHQVELEQPWRGVTKLARMAAMAIAECLEGVPREDWSKIPLFLCVAESERPGRLDSLDQQLYSEIEQLLDTRFAPESIIVPRGRVSVALALARARELMAAQKAPHVVIAASDSLLSWPTLRTYQGEDRLLTATNSNGFMPGEAAGALLVGPSARAGELTCAGFGFGTEPARINSGEPLRADGLTKAIKDALLDAGREIHTMSVRITDLSGEQYYFKEAALALSRIQRVRTEEFDIWHPAECCGEVGAASGLICVAVAHMASKKHYAPGDGRLLHFANDDGARAALVGVVC